MAKGHFSEHHLQGKRFTRWNVLRLAHTDKKFRRFWLCQCDCGVSREVNQGNLLRGVSRSCGCLAREITRKTNLKHGYTAGKRMHPMFSVWAGMLDRCRNPKEKHFKDYGGRGIKVCDRWMKFENFLADMLHTWKPGLTIERVDNDGNYCANNCRWATMLEQANNKRNTVWISFRGERDTISNWARRIGIGRYKLYKRIFLRGWSVDRAFTEDTSDRGYPRLPKQSHDLRIS